jgi:hypothetical protein
VRPRDVFGGSAARVLAQGLDPRALEPQRPLDGAEPDLDREQRQDDGGDEEDELAAQTASNRPGGVRP